MGLNKLSRKAHQHAELAALVKELGFGAQILDAPAGTGTLTAELMRFGFRVTPCDLYPEQFALPGVSCERVDLNAPLPFPAEQFDGIVCLEGVEHLEDQYSFARECWRILRPGGKILITTPNLLSLKSRFAWLLTGCNALGTVLPTELGGARGGQHTNLTNYFQLRHLLHTNGFRIFFLTGLRYSRTAMAFFWLRPVIRFFTRRCLRDAPERREINEQIMRHVTSWDMLLGKKLVIAAEKIVSGS
jgi:2-polyprenyl-3-methyl-5-hydroxy-6-metoxy-1,4-benzoquinol methylase